MSPRLKAVLLVGMSAGFGRAQVGSFLEADLQYAANVCTDTTYTLGGEQTGLGNVADLDPTNHGCMLSDERQGVWLNFHVASAGKIGFTISPSNGPSDYDFAVWGPYSTVPSAPLTATPMRCGWSAMIGAVGLNYTALDLSETAGGDGWLRYMDVIADEWYVLYVDNFSMNGLGFDLTWQFQDGASLECLGGPEAEFTVSNDLITMGGSVSFTDVSSNQPYAWYWEFPGGLPSTSIEQHPQDVLYSAPGCFDVSLTAYNASGSDIETTICSVTVETELSTEEEQHASFSIIQVDDAIRIQPLSHVANYSLRLVDAMGRVVRATSNRGAVDIPTLDLRAGSYTLMLDDGGRQLPERVVIIH